VVVSMARTKIGQYPAKPELVGGFFLLGKKALEIFRAVFLVDLERAR